MYLCALKTNHIWIDIFLVILSVKAKGVAVNHAVLVVYCDILFRMS
jgi:hypothetical protein